MILGQDKQAAVASASAAAAGGKSAGVSKVTISILQTLRYLPGFSHEHKGALSNYRLAALNKELEPLLRKTRQLLAYQPAPRHTRKDAVDDLGLDFSKLKK